jgi:cell fate regulator YaaT (PSP1 superfamily)
MACASCAVGKDGKPGGCSGNCSGGCNRMNTFDWLAELDIRDTGDFDLTEVSFKNGARKEFYHNPPFTHASTGDWVLVEVPGGGGYDIGKISLSGDLVKMQMKKKSVKDGSLFLNVIRKANQRDIEKLEEIRASEREMMIRARVISRTLDLDMKIGDVEFQGDGRKTTFFYTADGRVDFRELIRHFAKEFKVKIEMRQIGARQESSRVGGIGSCGRELCCSTWLSDFKSVSTTAARYQQLAINQAKLSGMCGRLKCCLNYELDTYLDALEDFPPNPERLKTQTGSAVLIKTDVFRGMMVYTFDSGPERGKFYTLAVAEVKGVLAMNQKGEYPLDFKDLQMIPAASKNPVGDDDGDDDEMDNGYGGDLVGAIELPDDRKKKKKKKKKPFDRAASDVKNTGSNSNEPRSNNPPRTNQPPKNQGEQRNTPPRNNNDQRPPRNNDGELRNNPPRNNNDQRPPRNNDGEQRNNPPRNNNDQRPPRNNDGEQRNNPPKNNNDQRNNNANNGGNVRPNKPNNQGNRPNNNPPNPNDPPREKREFKDNRPPRDKKDFDNKGGEDKNKDKP